MGGLLDWFARLLPAIARLVGPKAREPQTSALPAVIKGTFRDPRRKRAIPCKIYVPSATDGPAPLVLVSHGLGGSRDTSSYLGRALAENGYFAFFLQHPGSDHDIYAGAGSVAEIRQRLQSALGRPEDAVRRYGDVPVVIDQITALNRKGRLAGRLDLARVGMAGHSFGARTTMIAAGQHSGRLGARFKDRRIRAGVVLSPNVPMAPGQRPETVDLRGIYDSIDIPLLHVTGTRDGVPWDPTFDPATRTLPFHHIGWPDQYLLVLDGATHGTFSDHLAPGDDPVAHKRFRQVVTEAVVLFFDAHLKEDDGARAALRDTFHAGLRPGDVFEIK